MKKILYIAVLAIVCWSCNKNSEVVEPKQEYKEGQKVTIKVATHDQNYNADASRKIVGTWNNTENRTDFVWEWEPDGEQIKIVYNGQSTLLDCVQKDANTATFEGNMPSGWQEGEEARVIAGDLDIEDHEWPISDQGQIKTNGIASNMMRFEGIMTQIDETVELKAVWTAFRFPTFFDALEAGKVDTRLPEGTPVTGVTQSIDLSAKCDGEIVTYHYDVNSKFQYMIQSSSSAGQNDYPFYICIVKPGTYTELCVTVTFNLEQSTIEPKIIYPDGKMTLRTFQLSPLTQSNIKEFRANESGTLEKDNIYTPAVLDCKYYFAIVDTPLQY